MVPTNNNSNDTSTSKTIEQHDLHGTGPAPCEVYHLAPNPSDPWAAVTGIPCPVAGCNQTVCWFEAGYVPGYRVCMAPAGEGFDIDSIRHRFLAGPDLTHPKLIRDDEHYPVEIEVQLVSAVGPRVLYGFEVDTEQVDDALPPGYTADYSSQVLTDTGRYSAPLVLVDDPTDTSTEVAIIRDAAGDELARLTANHPASSFGIPVLVYDGAPYGPGDWLEQPAGCGPLHAGQWVDRWSADPERTDCERELAQSFLSQVVSIRSPDGESQQLAQVDGPGHGALVGLLAWYDTHRATEGVELGEAWEVMLFASIDHCPHAACEEAHEEAAGDHDERGGDIANLVRGAVAGEQIDRVYSMIVDLLADLVATEPAAGSAPVVKAFLKRAPTVREGWLDEHEPVESAESSHVTISRQLWKFLTGNGCPCPRQVDAARAQGEVRDAPAPVPELVGQAAIVAELAPGALAAGVQGPGGLYKPDAVPTKEKCIRCGAPAMRIGGAGGLALCVRHQDDY